jgi:predicted nuclease of restriction endonuclease-like (RecB) superfamily
MDNEYFLVLNRLKEKIQEKRTRAATSVNAYLLQAYWEIGSAILHQQSKSGWGTKIIDQLSLDLRLEFKDMIGLSVRNLKYMRAFAEAYPHFIEITDYQPNTVVQPAVAQTEGERQSQIVQLPVAQTDIPQKLQKQIAKISWAHNITLLERVKNIEERLFYAQKTISEGWSRNMLVNQIEMKLHQRQGMAITNFESTLPKSHSDLASETFKSPYNLEFITLGAEAHERDLEKAILNHLTDFLMELGKGFAFVGKQYRLKVDEQEFFPDLVFYHTKLHCYVIIELKIGEFKPEHAGKLQFYLTAFDKQEKNEDDAPTIGILLCKSANKLVVEYSLKDIHKPIGIGEYVWTEALPDNIKGELPTVEEIEAEMVQEIKQLEKPLEKKMQRMHELLKKIKQPMMEGGRSPKMIKEIFKKIVLPLKKEIENVLADIVSDFEYFTSEIGIDNRGYPSEVGAKEYLKEDKIASEFRISLRLKGFKQAGTKAFDCWQEIHIATNEYNYTVNFEKRFDGHIYENLYSQLLTKPEIKSVAEKFKENVIDYINGQLERIANS